MQNPKSRPTAETNDLLTICATRHCRAILSYFRDSAANTASLTELVDVIEKESRGGTERASMQLHHSTLPRLAAIGAIEYDESGNTVQYRGHPELEALAVAVASTDA